MTASRTSRASLDAPVARVRPVVHRITTSTAAVVDDPTRDELAGLLAEVERSGRGSFVIAESHAPEQFLQAVRHAGGWTLDAGPHAQMRLEIDDTGLVEDVFAWWTCDLPAWRELPWQPVARHQQWLTRD